MNYQKIAYELCTFMGGLEDGVGALAIADELEQTDTVDYEVYDDDIKEIKTPDGINIIQLIAEPFTKYKTYIKECGSTPVDYKNYFKGAEYLNKANAYINSVYAKNSNDTVQEMDNRFLKAYNALTNIVTNRSRMEKLWGTYDDPFLGEGIAYTHKLLCKLLLGLIPHKLQGNTTLASVAAKMTPEVSIYLLETAEYIISIQGKLSKKIYYKAPLVSEITGERIDTISKTKYNISNDPSTRLDNVDIRPSEFREDSGLRDKGREVLVSGAIESIDNIIEIRNNNSLSDFAQLVTKLTKVAYCSNIPNYGIDQMVATLDKTFNSPNDVIGGITACIGEFNTKVLDPLNLQYKKFEKLTRDLTSLTDEQFASKEVEKSFEGKVATAATKPNIDDFEY